MTSETLSGNQYAKGERAFKKFMSIFSTMTQLNLLRNEKQPVQLTFEPDARDIIELERLTGIQFKSTVEHLLDDDMTCADLYSLYQYMLHLEKRHQEFLNMIADQLYNFKPTHKHIKRGNLYQTIHLATLQTSEPIEDGADVTVYRDEDGNVWVRPDDEFNDGRFESIK